ncbi:MAG TPA: carboxypeptidase regulatory-like domain-containing protein [Bacteroidales bacterium]|nr:carboxypeptidase regulatory-like domain-containing protein [Bacteroidales bacterium]
MSLAQHGHYGNTGTAWPFGPTDTGPGLYDQIWNAGNGYLNSTEYIDAGNLTKTSEAADDFDVPTGESWTIGRAAFSGYFGYQQAGGPVNVNVRIYSDNNGIPGTELHAFINITPTLDEQVLSNNYMATYWEVTFPAPITLTEGKYWISVQGICDFNVQGDWGWADAQNNPWIGEKLHWRNPLDGWGLGYTTWTPGDIVMFFGYFDRAFALYAPSFNNDMAAQSITGPASASGLGSSETIIMELKNEGALPQTAFNVAYIINNGTPVIENVGSLTVNPDEVTTYSFTTPADLSATGIYNIQLVTMLSGDQYTDNDTAIGQVVNYGTVYAMQDGVNITACEGTFTDPGGLYANFGNYDAATMTIYPNAAGHMVRLNFLEFDVTWSDFYIYDGENTSAPLIGYWQDINNPGVITALNSTGALTIDFEAPGWDNAFGWVALISCYDQPDNDFAITDFTKSTSLVYTDLEFTFTATLRNIGALAQSKDVSFYLDGALIGTVNTGMVNPTEYVTVTLDHTVLNPGNVTAEVTIPADGGDDPGNNSAEMSFEVFLIDTFVEYFEQETFPPDFWSVPANSQWLWQSSSGFPYEGIGCAQCYIPWGGTDTLVSPQLIIENGDEISLYLKTSLWWPGKLQVIWKNSATGVWTDIETLVPTMNYENYVIDISAAAGTNYLAFVPICDDPWSWGGELTMDNIVGISPMLYFVDEDLTAYNLHGTTTPAVNEPSTFSVKIKNIGANYVAGNTYSIKLMQADPSGDIELVSVDGPAISHLQEKTIEMTYTFQASGEYDIYAEVVYGPDMIPDNDISNDMHLYVQVSGTIEVEVGTEDDENYWIPMYTASYYSISQTIYPESMINQTGALTGLSYFYDNTNYGPINGIPVKIYIGTTTNTYLAGYIPTTDLILVYDDTVDFDLGYHEMYFPFSVPINYTGDNIVTYVYKSDPGTWNNVVNFMVSDVTDTLSAWSNSFTYINPELPDSGTTANKVLQIPVATFFMNTAGFGEITGTVYDENGSEFPGVEVNIDGTTVVATTGDDGVYFINEILGGSQSLTASMFEYEDNTQPITIQAGVVNYLDFNMVLKPRVDITGTVVGNDDPQNFLQGAQVKLSGYAGFITETDENGAFTLPWVYGNENYTLTISLNGFETYIDNNIQVLDGDIDLGIIELVELLSTTYGVYAETETSMVNISWNLPNTGLDETYEYDLIGNNGWANEPYENVWLGNIYETADRGTITSVEMYWADYMTFSGEVTLDILDAEGNIVMTSEPFMTVKNQWLNIDIPDVFFEGTFYAMVHWQDNENTTDFLGSQDTDPAQHAPNQARIMYPGGEPYELSQVVGDDVTFEIRVYALIETDVRSGSRQIESYNVYRGPLSDVLNASSWTPLNTEPVADTFYLDETWPPSVEDNYIWAVEAIYTTGTSIFSFSNPIVGSPATGIDEILIVDGVNVYPNPAGNNLFVETMMEGTAMIYSISGQEMGQYRLNGQINVINVSDFEVGLYFIRVLGDNGEIRTMKFVKK